LRFKNVKQSTLIGIAVLISALINLPRGLQLYDVVEKLGKSFTSATINDVIIRTVYLFVFSWIVLQFNVNWKYIYANYTKLVRSGITVFFNAVWFVVVVLIFVFVHQKITGKLMTDSDKSIVYFISFIVLIILIFISRILRYQIIRQEDIAEKELLKQQSLQNELSALKNQINPHFLFNSLNSLNSLVRENKKATMFVNKLSFMYRYILQSGERNLVSLKEELKFLDSYVYLIDTRYRNRFSIQINIDEMWLNQEIPVLALQLLVENAVKHNEISEGNPLQVKLFVEDNYLIVENKIKPRTSFIDSTGQGLVNIDKRYVLLKEKHIVISNVNGFFKVKLPLK
jgi:sensor histidine kinase YesM